MGSSKDFSIVTRILMDTAGFTTGKDKISSEGKAMERAVTESTGLMKKGFGELTSTALPALSGQFSGLITMGGSMKGVFTSLIASCRGLSAAVMATGIGAVLIAITLAISGLIGWMKRTDEGGDAMRKVFDVIKAVINVVLDKISLLGSAIYKITQGDFKGAWEDIKNAFTGWGDAMKKNIETAKELNDIQEKLETFNVTYALKRAEIERTISELQLKARKKQEDTGKIDLKFNEQLKAAKLDLYNLEVQQKQLEVDAAQATYDMGAKNKETAQVLNDKKAELIGLQTSYNESLRENIKLDNKGLETAEQKLAAMKKANLLFQGGDTGVDLGKDLVGGGKAGYASTSQLLGNKGGLKNTTFGSSGLTPDDGKLKAYAGTLTSVIELNEKYARTQEILANIFDKFNESLMKGANSFKDFAKSIKAAAKEAIGSMIAEGITTMILSGLKAAKLGPIGMAIAPALAALGAGLARTAFNSMIPNFAAGGILPNSGYALVGENGAELIQTSGGRVYNNSDTKNMLSGGTVKIQFVNGSLEGYLNYNQRKNNAYA